MDKVIINLANPRGFCAGVDRAIDIVNRALEVYGRPIYVKHEVVHNRFVVQDLENRGAIFVEEIDEIPDDSIVIFSAHGVSEKVETETKSRGLEFHDATCPLVTKVHMEVIKHAKAERDIILIGHEGHPEVEGTMGRHTGGDISKIYLVQDEMDAKSLEIDQPDNVALVTQTTLSVDDTKAIINQLKNRFPNLITPKNDDICYATQNRQDAVKQLALENEFMIVVGSKNSSNSNRLKEISTRSGVPSYLLDSADDLDIKWLINKENIGLTAGASAPEILVQSIINKLKGYGAINVIDSAGVEESITFKIPKELTIKN